MHAHVISPMAPWLADEPKTDPPQTDTGTKTGRTGKVEPNAEG